MLNSWVIYNLVAIEFIYGYPSDSRSDLDLVSPLCAYVILAFFVCQYMCDIRPCVFMCMCNMVSVCTTAC